MEKLTSPYKWGMVVDFDRCTGCGACVVACQAENNVPVVGREQVLAGREMHWLRIDWYALGGTGQRPERISQPMLCQHCENAPCEYVCPVEATVHSGDGLNEMIYNRCVGTRFCSNNCPYKVRRFNWFDFNASLTATEQLVKNPDVTVRERGVMEKCTFCVQRIRQAEIAARVDERPLRGSDVQTACQQACPTQAIVFGSLTDRDSPVARERQSARAYAVLDELGTEPRVRYLARVRNRNPDLEQRT
jgi:molybdopterin-containing oxidoreductase family iron-sulfur binding subunit